MGKVSVSLGRRKEEAEMEGRECRYQDGVNRIKEESIFRRRDCEQRCDLD